MNKAKLNFAIDALMFLCMMAIAGLGFLMKYALLSGRKAPSNLAVEWISLFLGWIAMIGAPSICIWDFFLLTLLALDIVLHWKMILYYSPGWSPTPGRGGGSVSFMW